MAAPTVQNLAQFDTVLKEFYGPGIVEDLNQEVPFMALLEKDASLIKFDGREWLVPIHTGRNSGVGSRGEGAVLPSAGAQTWQDYKIKPAYNYGGIKVTGQVMQQSRTDKGAFGRAVQLEMEGLKNDLRSELNFQFLRDGNGVRASTTTAATGTSLTLKTGVPYNILNENMSVDIYDSTLATKKSTVSINSVTIDPSTALVTAVVVSSSVTTVNGDVLVRAGNLGNDITGIDAIIGGSTYGNINPANFATWQSLTPGNSGNLRPINYSVLQKALDAVKNFGGGNPKYFFSKPEIRSNFYLYMTNERRVVNTTKYAGGFTSLEYDGKEFFEDQMAVDNSMYGIDPAYLYRLETRELHWIDDDGTILHRSFDNTDTYFANMRYYAQLACTKRNCQVKIKDLQQ